MVVWFSCQRIGYLGENPSGLFVTYITDSPTHALLEDCQKIRLNAKPNLGSVGLVGPMATLGLRNVHRWGQGVGHCLMILLIIYLLFIQYCRSSISSCLHHLFNFGSRGTLGSSLTMRSSILRPLLALACLFIGWAHSMDLDDIDLQDIKASKVLKMIPAGKPGSCADEPMDQILQDAATLAKNAVEAIETLLEGYKIENTDENVKILNMAYISFGVKYDMYDDCNDPELDPKKPMPLVITEGRRRLQTVTCESSL